MQIDAKRNSLRFHAFVLLLSFANQTHCVAATETSAETSAQTSVRSSPVVAATSGTPASRTLHGVVAQSELVDSLERVGIKCALREGKPISLVIASVHLGSAAYYKDLAEGDEIQAVVKDKDGYLVTISRNSKIFKRA